MAQRRTYSADRRSENEQPKGWFDPQEFARNQNRNSTNASRAYSSPDEYMRRDLPGNQGNQNQYNQGNQYNDGHIDYGRANYVSGHDASSGFPNYRNIEGNYNQSMNQNTSNSDSRDYNRYDTRNEGSRYNDDRRFNEQYGSDRFSNGNRGGNTDRYNNDSRRDNDRRHDQHDSNDRNWWDRTSDEIASWFGDDDAERRRRQDRMNGPHQGKGPKGYTRSDEKIREDVNEKLYHDSHIDASEIEVEVNDGEVKLTGSVDNRMIKRRVEDLVEAVSGVRDVENHLKVKQREDSSNMYAGNQDMTRRNWS
jgi:osmotically-inducible protein OsmY